MCSFEFIQKQFFVLYAYFKLNLACSLFNERLSSLQFWTSGFVFILLQSSMLMYLMASKPTHERTLFWTKVRGDLWECLPFAESILMSRWLILRTKKLQGGVNVFNTIFGRQSFYGLWSWFRLLGRTCFRDDTRLKLKTDAK